MKFNNAYITALDHYVPESVLKFADHSDYFSGNDPNNVFSSFEEFSRFTNENLKINSVRYEKEISLEEMIVNLMDKNVDDGVFDPESIDLIIVANDFHDQLKNFGHFVQHEFEMAKAKTIRITDNYCTNIDLSLGMAAQLLAGADKEMNVLILTGVRKSDGLNGRIIGNYGVLGDGAGLAVVSNNPQNALCRILAQFTNVQGQLYDLDYHRDNTMLHFQTYSDTLIKLLKIADLKAGAVDKIILHNANQLLLEQVLTANGFDRTLIDKTNYSKYGHLGGTDVLLNLGTVLKQTTTNVLSLNLGFVGTYVATLFQNVDA